MTNERDPELEKLYREHSREEPSAALDAAILAAAHRAVASGPRKAGEATRPQRWWMPLAAAAVIGVVAIGVVQQMPKETMLDATSVAPATAPVPPPASTPATPPPPPSTLATPPAPAQAPSAIVEQRSVPADTGLLAKKQKEADALRPAPPPPPAAPAAPAAKPFANPAGSAAGSSSSPKSTMDSAGRDNKVVAEPVPFPAAPARQKTEAAASAEAKRDAPMEQPMADARKDAIREERQAAAPAVAGAAIAPPPAAAPPPPASPAPAPAAAFGERLRAQNESVGKLSQSKNVDDEMRTLARDPDAWITRIRKLRDEGNTAQALRELKEFRALVPDAERRLPADLRSLQP